MNNTKRSSFKINLNRLIVVAFILLLLKLFTYTVQEFLPVFSLVMEQAFFAVLPFIIAFILAFLIEPLVVKLSSSFKIRRIYASLLVITVVIVFLVFVLVLLGSRLYRELAELAAAFPLIYDNTFNLVIEKAAVLQQYISLNPEIQNALNSSLQDLLNTLQSAIKTGSMGLLAILGSLPALLMVIVVSMVATLITSVSFPKVKEWLFQRIKGEYSAKSKLVASDLGSALVGFLRALIILVSVTAIVVTVGLLLIGNKYAFTLGILAGLLDLLPIIGPSLIFIPWIVVLLVSGQLALALKLLLVYLTATILRAVLEPKVMSDNIGIHPLPTLISMYVGLKLFGAAGLIMGPALLVLYIAVRKAAIFAR